MDTESLNDDDGDYSCPTATVSRRRKQVESAAAAMCYVRAWNAKKQKRLEKLDFPPPPPKEPRELNTS
jgi:hypothetical protein